MSTKNSNPADEVMCNCSGTRRDNIQRLYEQGMDVVAISRWTGALSGCGGCEWDIVDFLKELGEQKSTGVMFNGTSSGVARQMVTFSCVAKKK